MKPQVRRKRVGLTFKAEGGWLVKQFEDSVHVLPMDDLRSHALLECWCNPRVESHAIPLVIHNSADGRELSEPGRKMVLC